MDPVSAGVYTGGAAISALGSWLSGKSQGDAVREANERNERLTREAWARDDTAVSRRTQDLINSGLNPALAAGSAAGVSVPLRMEAEGSSGVGEALASAGQSAARFHDVIGERKRQAAATLAAQAQASKLSEEAQIARHDRLEIEAGRDPRNRSDLAMVVNALKEYFPKGLGAGKSLADGFGEKAKSKTVEQFKAQMAEIERLTKAGDVEGAKRVRDDMRQRFENLKGSDYSKIMQMWSDYKR